MSNPVEHHQNDQGTSAQPAKPNQLATVSDRKREANRKNAQHSTGPRTQAGKNRSCRNAVKHGFLAKVVTLPKFEPSRELKAWSEELIQYVQPEGPLERMQVDLIIQAYWKLRRFQVAENAFVEQEIRHADLLWQYQPFAYQECGDTIHKIAQAHESVAQHGYVDASTAEELQRLTSHKELGRKFAEANKRAESLATRVANESGCVLQEDVRKARSKLLRALKKLHNWEQGMEEYRVKADDRRARPFLLRNLSGVDGSSETWLRYQAATQNQLYRALAELERLQRQRLRDQVPPPLKLTM